MGIFQLETDYTPSGDQEQAIAKLLKSLDAGNKHQCLLGVTGSGKTFTMANIIAAQDRPVLVLSHNKTLAAQLYSELKAFFPHNAVEYFVSYFDYYQPEAYIASTDTYIEKDSAINDEIDRLCLNAMRSLLLRRDVIVVASVSCIYGLGSPEDYRNLTLSIREGQQMDRDAMISCLAELLFERNDYDFDRGRFRVRGDVVEIYPAQSDGEAIRVEFFGDEIDRISLIDAGTGRVVERMQSYLFFPVKQYVSAPEKRLAAIKNIRLELAERVAWFEQQNKLIEAQRLKMRTDYDLELINEIGFCKGIENYSRHLAGRAPGSTPSTLQDYFPEDHLTIIDESHATVPQIGGMYEGDRSRKQVLVDHGFRLPSALDNRPLRFDEFMARQKQLVYMSATPGPFEYVNCVPGNKSYIPVLKAKRGNTHARSQKASQAVTKAPEGFKGVFFHQLSELRVDPHPSSAPVDSFNPSGLGQPLIVEQLIRPTGLLEPKITLLPLDGQIDKTIELCRQRVSVRERVLVTTLTKRTAEDLTDYLRNVGLQVEYIHADVDAIERVEILRKLRSGKVDILVGINLLREGLDLPEVSLVCILDADKEGFLRNETSLVQTAGRAARHVHGECVLFCDELTDSIKRLVQESDRRRATQMAYNTAHGITPHTVARADQSTLRLYTPDEKDEESGLLMAAEDEEDTAAAIRRLEKEMKEAAARLDFEVAAVLRDKINLLRHTDR
ncbi:MAG: excinuclease ABC subunit UvrB [Akkermansia sp.]|nr:excinuclease ABC subunit UvrB [Akkermansia sp.]